MTVDADTLEPTGTRERILQAAAAAFAERGFYGTSIATIVATLPLTKQALLHHFGSKQKLYGEVLRQISERLTDELNRLEREESEPVDELEHIIVAIYDSCVNHPIDTALLMRELLDNPKRAAQTHAWYLQPFLERMTEAANAAMPTGTSRHVALAWVYQLLGAINYFVVSEATLQQMLGATDYGQMRQSYKSQLKLQVRQRCR